MRIFVAGLSKSGKTTRSLHAADHLPGLQYISISQMLKASGGILPVATLADGLVNQEMAAEAVLAHPRTQAHQIIDGHALIETLAGPLLVPDAFFQAIAPDLLIHVQDDPSQILLRRQPSAMSVEEVAALGAVEQAACERIAAKAGIPLVNMSALTLEGFCDEVERLLSACQ